jgi:hypothetical protein
MSKTYRTAQGRQLDLEKLRLQNELVPAIGNMRVNARGDQLGPGGKVVKNREQMIDEHYKAGLKKTSAVASAGPDVIPTKGGKSKRVEQFEPGEIQPDTILNTLENQTPPVEDDFVDPELTQKAVIKDSVKTDEVTGIALGEKKLKGGLARAVAKTQQYESNKNKPKRL